MKTLKKIVAVLAVMTVAMTAFAACGDDTTSTSTVEQESSVAETAAPETSAPEEETEAETETEEEPAADDFSLADVDASMIDTGLYAKDDAGVEYVLAMFTHDNTPYCAMIAVTDDDNDVICGAYEAATQTDEDGIDWTLLTFDDVYTGQNYEIGFAEAEGECLILNQAGDSLEAEYLSADDTITYFAAAVVAPMVGDDEGAEDGDAEDAEDGGEAEDGAFTLGDVDASMIETGLYSKDETAEYVLALFKYDGAKYCAMISLDADSNGDVICGEYTGNSMTDDEGIAWSLLDFTDVYTGKDFEIGFAEADGECLILDQDGNAFPAEYLSADDTITYFGTAAALAEN